MYSVPFSQKGSGMLFVRGQGTGDVLDVPFENAEGFTCICAVVQAKDAKRMWEVFKNDPATFEGDACAMGEPVRGQPRWRYRLRVHQFFGWWRAHQNLGGSSGFPELRGSAGKFAGSHVLQKIYGGLTIPLSSTLQAARFRYSEVHKQRSFPNAV